MTVIVNDASMLSDITPESAHRRTERSGHAWRLSWLPARSLTRVQALAGMRLDEILSDPAVVYDRLSMAQADAYADQLGILHEHAVILLAKRMAERDRARRPTGVA
ncbi:hypothetical protein [Nocardia alni]|uniref:hypothetical protein n=1 Tax=Nocardia alni TaxID=2815723 RepID=UPI001C219824|nr:hypothetical protein [Nocardia alni]